MTETKYIIKETPQRYIRHKSFKPIYYDVKHTGYIIFAYIAKIFKNGIIGL